MLENVLYICIHTRAQLHPIIVHIILFKTTFTYYYTKTSLTQLIFLCL
jgi:hypothetical protein